MNSALLILQQSENPIFWNNKERQGSFFLTYISTVFPNFWQVSLNLYLRLTMYDSEQSLVTNESDKNDYYFNTFIWLFTQLLSSAIFTSICIVDYSEASRPHSWWALWAWPICLILQKTLELRSNQRRRWHYCLWICNLHAEQNV